jgi:hypothetical protein
MQSPSLTIDDLLAITKSAFAFVAAHGYSLADTERVFPDSFKGGFVLTWKRLDSSMEVEYLDQQLTVRCDERELFGAAVCGPFAGKMLSPEHLPLAIGRIAVDVQSRIAQASAQVEVDPVTTN